MKREPRRGTREGPRLDGARCLVVEARFYPRIADALLQGALAVFKNAGARCDVLTVPGALEIPTALVVALDAATKRGEPYEAAVALGCVIRGETSHYDIVAGESARALMEISVARGLPLGNGILTVDEEAQALERADMKRLDKGGGAAEAALCVLAIKRGAPAAVPRR
ncbi:MAG: 6,7-dimethyl-8-ribityllumazine synthase [Hyphomicrobiales bacterium]|nr:6,7-dimethyl-8-ribityllumazine synthase [Hyphomicrobiales bacterium]MBV9052094.1 6,7-dimethyl-8-ribityllumazine synthase [Hyphomicrobiales bacterium]MBV9588790.1 6,7-dimethyl-8-ribityllumazine synthase [Hyphomicrobiales bacterium]MBV9752385.1 6,7-dimethyl-8-ribityllumazine synthase [Hyphomicrobiales bacterium]MBV9977829.1 6,7-dimethyl-8-ribityllumazine synthase [Hyphomicrobiales bacterium]